jgi:predicted AlkP superfamily pyrophosphatase or phosphodiesterase
MPVVARILPFFLLLLIPQLLAAAAKPKLVFILIIDQFRADYLEKYRADFVPGGFNRLLKQGAVFVNNNYDYSGTETSPGHATISTGALPAAHGIIGNAWYDRTLKKTVTSVEDAAYKTVGVDSKGPGISPNRLIGTGLADEMHLAFGGQAVAVSIKARAAVLPGGKGPTAVFWFDEPGSGKAVSSTYYMDKLPSWVEEFNQQRSLAAYVGREWRALDAKPGDPPLSVLKVTGYGTGPVASPFGNDVVLELARGALKEYKLGQGRGTDFLSVSLSANDYVGHAYGPDSPQVADLIRRTDRQLAGFFASLDRTVGTGNWVMAFSADHGVAPNPELMMKQRIDAGRIEAKDVLDPIEKSLQSAFDSKAGEKWVVAEDLPNVYLNYDLAAKYHVTAEDAARRACQASLAVRGVLSCYTLGELAARRGDGGVLSRRVANSYFPGRSGDINLILIPFWIRTFPNLGANHGTPWSFDTHVPLIFMGPGFKTGVYQTPATPADLAVTLAALLGINPPAVATGRVLDVALAAPAPKPATSH